MTRKTRGTLGRVYGGDPSLVHIADGQRRDVGKQIASYTTALIRSRAEGDYLHRRTSPLCPGCYQVALFNAALALAKANGQSATELGNTMANAFAKLAAGGDAAAIGEGLESIECVLDPPESVHDRIAEQRVAFNAFAEGGALDGLVTNPPVTEDGKLVL
jgi:hypothetical protein